LDKVIRHSGEIPYLAPEICLLYKSTELDRDGYQQDFALAYAKLDDEARAWLDAALA